MWNKNFEIIFEYDNNSLDFIPIIALYIHRHFNEVKQKWHFHFMIQWLFWFIEFRFGNENKEMENGAN